MFWVEAYSEQLSTTALMRRNATTVWLKSQTGCPILYCKRPIWRVGVWPKWVGPAHSTLGQLTRYTSRSTHPKMSDFCPVDLKWHTFLSWQLWLILVLS